MKNVGSKAWLLLVVLLLLAHGALAGWNYSNNIIPLDEIQSGGPPKDGIPALNNPDYLPATKATFMRAEEQVIGVYLNGVARAYPTRILSWHELVNDRFDRLPVLVSW